MLKKILYLIFCVVAIGTIGMVFKYKNTEIAIEEIEAEEQAENNKTETVKE